MTPAITFTSGTFGGTGTYVGNVSLGSCHLSPGDGGIGTLTVAGNMSLSPSSVLDYDFGNATNVCDTVMVNACSIVLAGTLNVSCSGGTATPGDFALFSALTSITDDGLKFGSLPAGENWWYHIYNGSVYVVVSPTSPALGTFGSFGTFATVVPEPRCSYCS